MDICRLRCRACANVLLMIGLWAFFIRGAWAEPAALPAATRAAEAAPELSPATEPMPTAELEALDRAELGASYDDAIASSLPKAHALLEACLSSASGADRKAAIAELQALNIEPGIVGRLARIRLFWPAPAGGSIFKISKKVGPFDVRYLIGLPPGYSRGKAWPMVVHLPSEEDFPNRRFPAGEEGDAGFAGVLKAAMTRRPAAVVIVPLPDEKELFGPGSIGTNAAMRPLFDAPNLANIDPAHVGIEGRADAGFAVWNLALHFPTYFSAAAPMGAAANYEFERLRLVNLHNLLTVVWQDADDPIVKPAGAREIVRAMRNLKLDVDFIETHKLGHEPNAEIRQECYQRLMDRARPLYPKAISLQSNRPETFFNRIDWLQIWGPVAPGEERRQYLRRGPGFLLLDQNTWRIDASIDGQKINVTADNIDSFRLYLNDQMMNLSLPITVTVNHKPKFEGIVKQSLTTLVNDQVVLGRGFRYFTAAIDIDVAPPTTRPTTRPVTQPTTAPAPSKGRILIGPQPGDPKLP